MLKNLHSDHPAQTRTRAVLASLGREQIALPCVRDGRHSLDQNRQPTRQNPLTVLKFALMLGLLPGCTGYMIGGTYAQDIRTVQVPTFTTDTYRRGFELQLTEAVQQQIQQRTPYRLTKGTGADTRLTGHIVEIRKDVLTETKFDDPRELQLSLAVEVRWEDLRTGQMLARQQVPLNTNAAQLIAQAEFAPEVGQSLATATQDAVDRLARQIVGMMEAPW